MRISIAMATYNGGRFLQEQLDSFLAQSRLPDELIVTDDGSTDDTVKILRRFAKAAPFKVRVERNPKQLGAHRNFERALSLCTGDIVLLSDQDDIWYAEKIETVVDAFDPEALALYHDEHLFEESGLMSDTFMKRAARIGWGQDMLTAGNCTVLRREALKWVLPFPEQTFFDDWINLVMHRLGARQILATPLQKWRRHGGNGSSPAVAEPSPKRKFVVTDPRPSWTTQKNVLGLTLVRIAETFGEMDPKRKSAVIKALMADITRLEKRIEVVSNSKLTRWAKVGKLWSEGFYRPYSGWKSAMKDALIP